jgi:quinol monooxygenase YgiN
LEPVDAILGIFLQVMQQLSIIRKPKNMTGVMLKFTAQTGKRDALVAHLIDTARLAKAEEGTLLWTVHLSPIDPNAVYLYEAYASDAAKQLHESSDEYATARAGTNALVAGPPEVFPLLPVGGKGL